MPFRKIPFFDISPVTVIAAFLGILIALVALLGWIVDLESLQALHPDWPGIKVNTAIGIIFSGISLLLFSTRKKTGLALFLAMLVFLIGILSLSEYLFHWNAHIDELLFTDKRTPAGMYPGRMAKMTTIALILTGSSLLFYSYKNKWVQKLSEFSAILLFIMSFAGFIGALYDAGGTFRAANIASFSIPTALSGLFMSVGILFSKADTGVLAAFHKQTAAARAGIRGIIIIITILVVIGWLCLKGNKAGLFDMEMGLVIMITTFTISFLFVALSGIRRLNLTEDRLIASEKDLRHVLSSTADVFYVIDRDYRITLINEMAKKNLARAWGRPVRAGASILDLIPDEKDEPIRKSFDRVFAGEKIEYELHNQAKQDLPEWVSVSYKPVIDNDGTVIGAYIVTRDITERKKAESEVRKSEERYRSLIEQASDYIMITDQKGNFIDVNSSLCKEFGYKREELLKMNISSLIDPLQLKHDPIRFDLLITGAAMLRERRMMNKDGSVIEVEANVKMLPDGRILAIARDIRERKQIEQELKEAEIKFRNLVEQSLVGVYIIQDGKFAYVNPRFAEIFGYSQQELINAYPVEIVVHPDDRATVTENIRERLQGEKDSVHYEVNGQKKDGEIVKIEIFGSRTQYLGNPAIIGTLLDITERQQAQQALITSEETRRLIMDSALDAIVSMDTRGHITAWTPQAEKIFGWKENEVIGKTIADTIIPVQYRERHKKGLEKYLQTGEGPVLNKIIEISALKRDGTGFPIELSIIPVKQGETEFFCAFIRDITERKKAEEELLKSEERYRILVENATEALVVMDVTKKKFISVSESAVKLFGMTKEYLLSVGPIEVSPEYQPDGRLSSEAAMEKIGEAIAGGKPSFEWMHCDKNGKLIPCEVWLVRLPAEDQILVRGSIIDITERKKAEKQITESYAHIRQLTEHLQNIREEERIHIAREIHDELGQQLTVLKMDASWLNKKLASAENTVKQKLQGLLDLLDSTVKTVRRISSELRPSLLDDMGLVAAMEWHLKEFENRSALKVRFTTPEKELSLPDAVKTGLFRIFQESLTNVARHADAKKIEISLQPKNGNIILSIRDDGRGFEKEKVAGKKTLGILGMKERSFMMGGSYEITSTPGKGTFVVVSVPYGN